MNTGRRILTSILAASVVISAAVCTSGCELKGHSPEDSYVSPYASKDTPENEEEKVSSEEKKPEESSKESEKNTSKETEPASKAAESKKEESKPTESKKPESKATESKKEESKAASSKAEEKKDDVSPLYKDMVGLIKDDDVVGYTICKIAGSNDEHLVIEYGRKIKAEDTDTANLIILDPEGYASEQAQKEKERRDKEEGTRLYSIYRLEEKFAVPEGDIDGYYTTAYISPNSNTLAMYYVRQEDWKYGLIELNGGSAFANYTYAGKVGEDSDAIPPMPGEAVKFSKPDNFELIKKYR